jgi:AcrR family transcriptional regulator
MPAPPKRPAQPKRAQAESRREAPANWAERVADRSPMVQRSRDRGVEQATAIVAAARRLIESKGPSFTTHELIKEAGIALQTFYRYFPSKDHLLLAVIENVIDESCAAFQAQARTLADPVERLRYYVAATVAGLGTTGNGPSFITSEHFRLQTLHPAEVAQATQHYTDLLVVEIRAAVAAGLVRTEDAGYSAWLITQLTMAVFHHYDCAGLDEPVDRIVERLWGFCIGALGGAETALASAPPAGAARGTPTRKGGPS